MPRPKGIWREDATLGGALLAGAHMGGPYGLMAFLTPTQLGISLAVYLASVAGWWRLHRDVDRERTPMIAGYLCGEWIVASLRHGPPRLNAVVGVTILAFECLLMLLLPRGPKPERGPERGED